jgi:glycosyltransferase involved in cell wall biosynthesis
MAARSDPKWSDIRRVLLVSADSIAPGPTGSGNRAIRWGLFEGLLRCGIEIGFYVGAPTGRHAAEFEAARYAFDPAGDRFWLDQPGPAVSSESVSALGRVLQSFLPDLVLAYGLDALKLIREANFCGPIGIMSIDLEYLPALYRHVYNIRFGRPKQKLKSLLLTPRVLLTALQTWYEVLYKYPSADFVISHAANHANWHRRQHYRPTIYTPNPLSALFDTQPTFAAIGKSPRFILVGGIGGIATLTGLAWFARKVYPLLEPAIIASDIEVHLIGRGELEPSLDKCMPHLVKRGYVDDLTDEMRHITAVLIPTPIALGFRTRIVDAFRHGVTVIAHEANAAGMPELMHGHNALVAADPEAFAQAILQLARTPEDAARLGHAAFEQFRGELNSTVIANRILKFVQDEVSATSLVAGEKKVSHD